MPSSPSPTAVSLFSGAGGSSEGYAQAGYRVLWANEFIDSAADTYRINHPHTILTTSDIRTITPTDILRDTGLDRGDLDLLDGSPPCAPFSTAGHRSAAWGKVVKYSETRQRTDDLFYEYIRILDGLQPRAFVAENVAGLVRGAAVGYFKDIHRRLHECGYRVAASMLDASYLGVPQVRRRVIFIGVRANLGLDPIHPKPGTRTPMSAVLGPRAALWVNTPRSGKAEWVRIPGTMPCPTVQTHGIHNRDIAQLCLTGVPPLDLDPETGYDLHPVPVHRMVVHPRPEGARIPTLKEMRALCGFPATYHLTGTYRQRWERLGRAVPPPMMRAIAETLREHVLCAVS